MGVLSAMRTERLIELILSSGNLHDSSRWRLLKGSRRSAKPRFKGWSRRWVSLRATRLGCLLIEPLRRLVHKNTLACYIKSLVEADQRVAQGVVSTFARRSRR